MRKNFWMTFCLFLGCLLSVALASSLPTYSNAIIRRLIVRGYEQRGEESNTYPLIYSVQYRHVSSSGELSEDRFNALEQQVKDYYSAIGVPDLLTRKSFSINSVTLRHISLDQSQKSRLVSWFRLSALYDINDHIEIIHGRRPEPAAGEYEVLVSQDVMVSLGLSLSSGYEVDALKDINGNPVVIRPVGIFIPKDLKDPYWFDRSGNTVFFDPDVYDTSFYYSVLNSQDDIASTSYNTYTWDFILDYRMMTPEIAEGLTKVIKNQTDVIKSSLSVSLSNMDVLDNFNVKKQQISYFLPTLLVPTIALLTFYISMISGLVVDYDKNERTLMQSRGAGKSKIVVLYLYQAGVIALLSLSAGIPLGIFFCKMVGSSNGFLEFVDRTPLEIAISWDSIVFSIIGAGLFLLMMLLPVVFSREDSIVVDKRKRSRPPRTFFEKYYIDIALLVLSIIGLYTYRNIAEIMTQAGVSAEDMPVNPLLFIISSMFIFGCCLLFTRIYPYIIGFLFRAGQRVWRPVIYTALINTARMRSRGRFLMIFLVATVSMGIFSSAAARTINRNYEDRIGYYIGADVKLKERWESIDPDPQFTPDGAPVRKPEMDLIYPGEPPFSRYLDLEGVKNASKVYMNSRTFINIDGHITNNINVMCVVPHEFSEIAWNRNDLYPYHFIHMMNALTQNPYSVLVSENLLEKLNVKQGDSIAIGWKNNKETIKGIIYDSFRYFPAYDPTATDENGEPVYLIIMNYELVDRVFRREPYEVWISKEDGYSSAEIYRQITDRDIPLEYFENSSSGIVEMKNDPLVQGMNGNLTLSFLVTIIITVTGFMIYWIFYLKSRQLQMGIIRSMGMSTLSVIGILLWEQVFMSFLPMLVGFCFGGLSANIFVPMFEFGVTASKAVPPYRIFIIISDYLRLGAVIVVVILLAMIVLGVMVSRLRISQTLKLGED